MKYLILTACAVLLSMSSVHAQDKNKELKSDSLHIEIKSDAGPDIYLDGKKFDFPIELLDKEKITSVDVIKGEKAINEYNAKNGVVLITTKMASKVQSKLDYNKIKGDVDKMPMVIIDGVESNQETLKQLSPNDIESINVVKGEQAMKKYNAANGVVIVKTKKGNKK